VLNQILVDQLASVLAEVKVNNQNYYISESDYASASLEWVIEGLQGHLAKCLNASEGYCDIWYLESHSQCKLLMDILYEFTSNDLYNRYFGKRDLNH